MHMEMVTGDVELSVIVPIYNERVTVRRLLERVCAVPIRKQIVLVDDGSTDGTREVLEQLVARQASDPTNEILLLVHERNRGKGAAIRTAIPHLRGKITLIQDADLEYDPSEYPKLLDPILRGDADVVYGSRFQGGPRRVLLFWHTLGNRLLTLLSNLCTDLNLTDMETCYKVFRTDILRRLRLVSDRFTIEPEITAKVARLGCRIYEVPISYRGREYWEGKKIGWRDGFQAVWAILRYGLVEGAESADPGYKTLQRMRKLRRYNEWVWRQLAPHVGDRVLEVGCGVGNVTQFLRNRELVLATDNNPDYLTITRNRFERNENIAVRHIDWENPDLEDLRSYGFDTIVCLNVLEHLREDEKALAAFAELLVPGGKLLLQVPALPALYGEIDRAIGHHRRYRREELAGKLERAGFEPRELSYSNVPGVFGWWVNSVVLKRKSVPGVQARFANNLLPILRLERHLRLPFGMTLLAIAEKPRSVGEETAPASTDGSTAAALATAPCTTHAQSPTPPGDAGSRRRAVWIEG
jgi:glycosyltransferase involved in cell wall biosynthesis